MKICFLNPPFRGAYNREVRFQAVSPQKALHPPLMLAYATAVCEREGHEVDLIDAPALDLGKEQTLARLAEFRPDFVVMLTSTGSVSSDGALAKGISTEIGAKTVAVGVHATAVPEDTLERGFDFVARGEYEYTIRDLASGMPPSKVLGITYWKGKRKMKNGARPLIKDLDSMPFPSRKFLPNEKYHSALYKNPFTFILAGRGCPQQCVFCAAPQLMSGRMYRMRSAENIVRELKQIKEKFPKLRSVLFNDDTLTVNKKKAMELCGLMIKEKVNMPWIAYSRVDTIDEELAKKMKEAGCFLVKVGFESGCDEILRNMKKGPRATTERAREAAKIFNDAGIQVHGTFVFGMPGEDKTTIRKTIDFAKSLDLDFVQFSVAQPYPGTEFYEYLKKNKWLKFGDWDDYLDTCGCIKPVFGYPHLSSGEMEQWLKVAYKEYYLRPKYMLKALRIRLTNPSLMKSSFRSAKTLLSYIFGK